MKSLSEPERLRSRQRVAGRAEPEDHAARLLRAARLLVFALD